MVFDFFAPFIGLAAAGVAVVGNTWNVRARGWRRITRTGWVAITVAVCGFGLSTFSTYEKHQEKKAQRAAAIQEIDVAWKGLVAPYRLMLWEIDGYQSNPDDALIERVMKKETLNRINQIDLRGDAPHHHGLWFENICGAAKRGHDDLRRAQTIYVGIIDADLITKMKDVAADYMIQAMMVLSPCGEWSPSAEYPLKLESITNFRELPRYLAALLALRRELDEG